MHIDRNKYVARIMDFEYVKILNKKESADYISNISKARTSNQCINLIRRNSEIILKEYDNYEEEQIHKYRIDLKQFKHRLNLWRTKTCKCGQPLTFVNNMNFWGCSDYKNDETKHITFRANQDEMFDLKYNNIKVRINQNWCSDILKRTNLHGQIKSKSLIQFYLDNGCEDLRSKYGYKNTIDSISSYVKANRLSKLEEEQIKKFLTPHFQNISYQTYIRFKRQNERPRTKIVDLIVSNSNDVFLIEIKRFSTYLDLDQIRLYHDLLKYLMKTKKDSRTLKSLFIISNKHDFEYHNTKCIFFEEINKLEDNNQVISMMNENNLKLNTNNSAF